MNVFQKAWKRLLEAGSFYRYLVVGVGTSLLDFSLFSLLSVGFDLPVIPSNITSTIITVCVSYWINQHFVFQAKGFSWASFFSFAGLTLFTGMVLQSAIIWAIVHGLPALGLGLSLSLLKPAAKIVAMGTGAVCNYLGYRFIFTRNK